MGVLGFGVNSSTGIPGGVLHGRLFTFMYQSELGVGINASPLVFNVGLVDDNKNASLTFVNTSVFFNIFRQYRDNLLLGPFVGINAVNYNNPRFFELHSGLMFSLRNIPFGDVLPNDSIINFNYELLHIELGYYYNPADISGFYVEICTDLIGALYAWGTFMGWGVKP